MISYSFFTFSNLQLLHNVRVKLYLLQKTPYLLFLQNLNNETEMLCGNIITAIKKKI